MIFDPDELIISKPEFMRTRQKMGSYFTFALFWVVFLFLLKPFFTLFGWVFTTYILKKELFDIEHFYSTFIRPVLPYYALIAFMLIVVPIWMMYNKRRFGGGNDKRARAAHRVLGEKVRFDMGVTHDDYMTAISCGALIVYFDEDAKIIAIRDMCPPEALMPEYVFDDGAMGLPFIDDYRLHREPEDVWPYDDDQDDAVLSGDEATVAVEDSLAESELATGLADGVEVDNLSASVQETVENQTWDIILAIMLETPTVSARGIGRAIGISIEDAKKEIRALKKAGMIRRVGPANGGYWTVKRF